MAFRYWTILGFVALAGCAATEPAGTYPPGSLGEQRAHRSYTPTNEAALKAWPTTKENKQFRGEPLDLDGFHVTFNDDFDQMSVTDANGAGPWYAPVHADFGGAHFVPPQPGKGPIFVKDGKLAIQMYMDNKRIIGGLVQSVNKEGQGFAQQYGYFEMRAKMPKGRETWAAFWLHSHPSLTGPRVPQTEIDVIEAYGDNPKGHHKAVHLWPVKDLRDGDIWKHAQKGVYNTVEGMFDDYHTYGVMITSETMTFYYDRKELVRMPTPPEAKTPQYMLMNLTSHPGVPYVSKDMMEMDVDYVRVWQKDGGF